MDDLPVTAAAAGFGLSRESYYQAAAALDRGGLPALAWAKPGPKGAHKLTEQVCAFAEDALAADPRPAGGGPGRPTADAFGVRVHPPLDPKGAGPAPGAIQEPLTCPPREQEGRRLVPAPTHLTWPRGR